MKTHKIIVSALSCILGLSLVQAQETVRAASAQEEVQAARHPFFQTGMYPSWSEMTPEAGLADLRVAKGIARARIDAICAIEPGQETYENVFAAWQDYAYELDFVAQCMNHLQSVAADDEVNAALGVVLLEMEAFEAEAIGNGRLWEVIKRAAAQEWVQKLSPAKQRYVQQVVDHFRSNGADLSAGQKARLGEINAELVQLEQRFDLNVQEARNAYFLLIKDASQLAGMPEAWMKEAAAEARRRGLGSEEEPQWIITADKIDMSAVLTKCEVEAVRKLCWEMGNRIGRDGAYDNEAVVARIMELRAEKARLLGYKNFADLVCHSRMVDSGDKALAFVDGMMQEFLPAYEEESRRLLDFISQRTGVQADSINPWDLSFYMDQYSMEYNDFDGESMRDYLRSDYVLKGMFSYFSELYDISVEELPAVCLKAGEACPEGMVEVWHPEVQVFKITDNKTGAHLGSFYFDPYPRASKRPGGWVCPLRAGRAGQDGQAHEPHLAALVVNLNKPDERGYARFSQYDVTTVFHEFGHILHNMLSDTEVRAQSGSRVAWDFVELPSQFSEHWAWEQECISRYAFHHETGEAAPVELLRKLAESRNFMAASAHMRQLRIAKLDLEAHMNYAEKFAGKGLDAASQELLGRWEWPVVIQSPSMLRYVPHCISGGYRAGYFCYMWAEVLSANAYVRFRREGVGNREVGADFRNSVLKNGDSRPAGDLFLEFSGSEAKPSALLEELGIKK